MLFVVHKVTHLRGTYCVLSKEHLYAEVRGEEKMPALETIRHVVLFEGISMPAVAVSSL